MSYTFNTLYTSVIILNLYLILFLQLDLSQLTQEAHDISKIMVNVIHGSKDEAAIMTRALCTLTFEWVKKQMDEEDVTLEELSEKVNKID